MLFMVAAMAAEMERDLIRERTRGTALRSKRRIRKRVLWLNARLGVKTLPAQMLASMS
jgi:DNA invertase Pin-like site-specific DNA recombinase